MSKLLTLTSTTNVFSFDPPTPLILNPEKKYYLGVLGFSSYNSIPNIEGEKFYYYEYGDPSKLKHIVIPTGCYEITAIEATIKKHLPDPDDFYLRPNNNTIQCEIYSKYHTISFPPEQNNLGRILGFSKTTLEADAEHSSDLPINIIKVCNIHFDSNITESAFYRDRPAHTIYEFPISVDPGYAIIERPNNPIYLPVNTPGEISNITVVALDQNFKPVNFRGEESILQLHLQER